MPPRRQEWAAESISPLLVYLVHALEERQGEERQHEAEALRAFGELAFTQVPNRGVFAPADDNELFNAIDDIAAKHLRLKKRKKAFYAATEAVEPLERRDEIESAAGELQAVSDKAYFYAGLAFGISFADRNMGR